MAYRRLLLCLPADERHERNADPVPLKVERECDPRPETD